VHFRWLGNRRPDRRAVFETSDLPCMTTCRIAAMYVLKAKSDITKENTMANGFTVRITYNGITKELHVQPEESVVGVLQRSIDLFSLQRQPHQMGLFTEAGVQVAGPNIQQSVEQAGLEPGQLLILRQVVVEGGAV